MKFLNIKIQRNSMEKHHSLSLFDKIMHTCFPNYRVEIFESEDSKYLLSEKSILKTAQP